MNKNIKKLALLFVAAATMFSVSCSKDDNKNNSGSGSGSQEENFELARLDVTYKITVDSRAITAMTEGYTPTLQYYDANNQSVTVTPFPFTANNLVWELSLTQASFPSHFGFKLSLTPKDGVGESVKYDCDIIPDITAMATGKNGKKVDISPSIQGFYWRGIKPSNGKVMKVDRLYKIEKDGSYTMVSYDDAQ